MLIISSLRFTADGTPPARPARMANSPTPEAPARRMFPGEKDHIIMTPIKSKSAMKRNNSACIRAEPSWEASIRGSHSPDAKCKTLMHMRKHGISEHRHGGLVTSPIGRSFVTPSELNMLTEKRNRHYRNDITVLAPARSVTVGFTAVRPAENGRPKTTSGGNRRSRQPSRSAASTRSRCESMNDDFPDDS